MKNITVIKAFFTILAAMSILILVLVSNLGYLHNFIWENEVFHSFIESFGGVIALIMATILFFRRDDKHEEVLFLIALGFLGMGILDSFHAATNIGDGFVFLHSAASLVGGFFFSLIWFPKIGGFLSKHHSFIWVTTIFSLLLGIWAFAFPNMIPDMVLNGEFTANATIINYLSGFLFLLASIRLFFIYLKIDNVEIMLLFILSFLFALSGFTFNYSALWDGGWWIWHLMRLIAYVVVLVIMFQQYIATIKNLKTTILERTKAEERLVEFNDDLEQIVIARTKELYAANQQLVANEQQLRTSNQQLEAKNQQQKVTEVEIKNLLTDANNNKNLLETIINSTPDWIFAKDVNFRYILVNEGYASALGIPVADFIGKDDIDMGFPEEFVFGNPDKNIVGFRNDDKKVLAGATIHNPYDPATTADGKFHIFDTLKIPLKDNNGNIYASLGFARDITKTKEIEEEIKRLNISLEEKIEERTKELNTAYHQLEQTNSSLQASETRFRSLIEKSKEAYLLIVEGKFVDCNDAAVDMLGFTKEELLTTPDIISPKFQPNGISSKKLAAEYFKETEQKGWSRFEWTYITKAGSEKIMEITLTNIEIGGQTTIFTTWHDITERKKAQKIVAEQLNEIKKINKKLENYSYTISHDLKEPIRSIRAFSEFISEDYADLFDDEAKDYFSRIINASNKMALMIDDMLILSRVGRVDIQYSNLSVSKLINDVEDTLHHTINSKKASIIYDEMPSIICQPVWIKAVFQNLIANSINYCDKEKPIIEIEYSNLPDYHEFSIKDNGKGIPVDQFEKIFGLFRKANQDKNSTGSGAGLAIVTTILEQHNGRVWVAKSELGVGTTIKFTINKNLK